VSVRIRIRLLSGRTAGFPAAAGRARAAAPPTLLLALVLAFVLVTALGAPVRAQSDAAGADLPAVPSLSSSGGAPSEGAATETPEPAGHGAATAADTPLTARGLLEPPAEAVLSSGIAGRIEALPRRAGERFAQGDLLARFDCALYEARLAAAEAEALKARRQLANDRQLADLASIGRLEVGLAEAELARAEAQAGVTAVLVERCHLTAPFDGRVVEWRAEPHETVAEGAPILEVVATGPPEVALIVPSRWLPRLDVGRPFTFAVDETGTRHDGTLVRLGARIDPASQTVRVIGRLEGAGPDLVPGMSGTALFAAQPGG